ncbi:MAG: DUF4125 family protein [Candidatus Hodarchaeota archaeon]
MSRTERKKLNFRKQKKLLKKIVDIELGMFQKIRTIEPSLCQDLPETFEIMRAMNHSVLSLGSLNSYLNDLKVALSNKRNLLTEKYARMNNTIPPLKNNPIINDIVSIEANWIEQLSNKYPLSINYNAQHFKTYLSCELETYSDKTLELYYHDILSSKRENRNLAEERFTYLFNKLGYKSIEEAEKRILDS